MSLMPDTIVRDLRLARHGYRVHPVGPYVVPFPDGRVMIEYDDPSKNHDEFAKFSKKDADALERWEAWIGGLAAVLGPLLMTTPPQIGSKRAGDLFEQLRLAWRFARPGRPHDRRGDSAAHDERGRSARPVLRVRTGQGRDGDRRSDRDVGWSP